MLLSCGFLSKDIDFIIIYKMISCIMLAQNHIEVMILIFVIIIKYFQCLNLKLSSLLLPCSLCMYPKMEANIFYKSEKTISQTI